MSRTGWVVVIGWIAMATSAWAEDFRGQVTGEYRGFASSPLDPAQHRSYPSVAIESEYYRRWDDNQSVAGKLFYRWDAHDDARAHWDVRELYWMNAQDRYEVSIGIRKVFWGSTESQHLVDVINQTDLVENPDAEEKLGQPMLFTSLRTGNGSVQVFLMPYFRERTFPGKGGRLRTVPYVDADAAIYEHGDEEKHVDWAVRWTSVYGGWDIGVSHFDGTNREPRLLRATSPAGETVLLPFYELMRQSGLDIQGVVGGWLWKLEAISRRTNAEEFWAATGGFEYTFNGVLASAMDVGLLLEYMYDERGRTSSNAFADDIMLGMRLTLNDVRTTDLLVAAVLDRDSEAVVYSLEANRRLTDRLQLLMEGRAFSGLEAGDPLFSFRRDSYLQLALKYYF